MDTLGSTNLDANNPLGSAAGIASANSVTSLDSAVLQQTKTEIRTLAAEVAQLAEADLPLDEFFRGFMPRVCAAMGATGACAWEVGKPATRKENSSSHDSEPAASEFDTKCQINLLASHSAPAELFDGPVIEGARPGSQHASVLDCIVAEGQPMLVPPGSVRLETDRPTNPLSEALIVIPVRIEARVDYLLEVVQRPSGGPTAQRGYLRFVAQMADLMSDFLRRSRLREIDVRRAELERLQAQLLRVARATTPQERLQVAALACADIAGGEQAFIVSIENRPRVISTSHSQSFDPRSEPVLACNKLVDLLQNDSANTAGQWLPATERRQADAAESLGDVQTAQSSDENDSAAETLEQNESEISFAAQTALDDLCDSLGGRYALCAELNKSSQLVTVIVADERSLIFESSTLAAVGGLLSETQLSTRGRRFLRRMIGTSRSKKKSHAIGIWAARAVAVALTVAVLFFPVTQKVTATAILQPVEKQAYHAPSAGTISAVLVEDGDPVLAGQPILQLSNPQLQSQLDELEGQRQLAEDSRREKKRRENDRELSDFEREQLASEIHRLEITSESCAQRIAILVEEYKRLTILARDPGRISAWDIENNLMHRPVQKGELLVSTYQPHTQWTLRIAVPQRRIGLVTEAGQTPRTTFSLSSHPEQTLLATVRRVATRVNSDESGNQSVLVEADVDADTLPLKKDGAVARAEIACGKVPLIWLVTRDAIVAIKSRSQMLW